MKKTGKLLLVLLLVAMLAVPVLPVAAQGDGDDEYESSSEFFNAADYERQMELLDMEPEGPADQPWLQRAGPAVRRYVRVCEGRPLDRCASPTRATSAPGAWWAANVMQAEVELHEDIAELIVTDAEGSDESRSATSTTCWRAASDLLIVSPMTTAALTPAVERRASNCR